MEWTGDERRDSEGGRMRVERPVAVFVGGKEGILRARTRDLSTGGMRLDLDEELTEGEKILFRIDLGEGFDPAVQGGKVIWSAPEMGTGVEFTDAEDVEGPPPRKSLPAPGEDIKLRIDRMDHALKVQCVEACDEGLVVRTDLPFLERGRNVTASFSQEDHEQKSALKGILTMVSLLPDDSAVPAIRLEIRTDGKEGPLGQPPEEATQEAAPPREPAAQEPEPEPESWDDEEPTAPDVEPSVNEEQMEAAEAEDAKAGEQEEQQAAELPPEPEPDESLADDEDPMGDAFRSLTDPQMNEQESFRDEGQDEESIEPRYVVMLRAFCAFTVLWSTRAGKALASYSREAWIRLQPVLRKIMPALTARAKVARDTLGPMAGRMAAKIGSVGKGQKRKQRTTRMRKQKSRSTRTPGGSRIGAAARSRLFFIALAVAALVGFGTGVWALVGLVTSGDDDAEAAAQTQGTTTSQAPSKGSFDLWGGSTLEGGTVQEAPEEEIQVVAQQDPTPAPAAAPSAPSPAPTQAPAQPAPVQGVAAQTDIVPGAEAPEVETQGFYLAVNGEVTGYDYYPLKDPAGLVVNVKGALPAQEGYQPVKRPGIKKVKAVARESGTRFIIYFEGDEIPDFQVLPAGSSLEVRLDA